MKKLTFLLFFVVSAIFISGCVRQEAEPGCPDASCCKTDWNEVNYEFRMKIDDRLASFAEGGGFTFEEKINKRTYWIGICDKDFEFVLDTLAATHPRYEYPPQGYPYLISGDIYENVSAFSFSGLPLYYIWVQRVKTKDGRIIFER